ncbi:hypothetical protein CHARACLAT_005857 [Characodon lateralis]|uniref:Uncharacterized protein n=1 Tax=Characodon lateralis TaxID=208331 RepID=A0ABU7DE34_9TELE|nr:hypothetical protein [Characodon lateralis]
MLCYGYAVALSIMGKTADLCIIDTLHKQGKPQKIIVVVQSALSKHINGKLSEKKNVLEKCAQAMTAKLKGQFSKFHAVQIHLSKVNFAFHLEIRVPETGGQGETNKI